MFVLSGLTYAVERCSRAGRVGAGLLQEQPEPWSPPPNLPLPSQGEGPPLRPSLPADALRRVLEHDPFGRELVADGVGAGEVAGLLGRCAFVDQRLDAGVVVAG